MPSAAPPAQATIPVSNDCSSKLQPPFTTARTTYHDPSNSKATQMQTNSHKHRSVEPPRRTAWPTKDHLHHSLSHFPLLAFPPFSPMGVFISHLPHAHWPGLTPSRASHALTLATCSGVSDTTSRKLAKSPKARPQPRRQPARRYLSFNF